MSTPLLDGFRFANISASLIHHATAGHSGGSCSHEAGEIFRAFNLDPFGRTAHGFKAPTDPAGAREKITLAIRAAAFDWQRLNYNAHVVRYEDEPAIPGQAGEQRPAPPQPSRVRGKVLPLPALLKALRALRYNCDGGHASGDGLRASLTILDTLIDALKDACLEMLPEYQAAEWAI